MPAGAMVDYAKLIATLAENGVDFILVGGVAATIHGSARLTDDLDIVYDRSDENLRRIVAALKDHTPYLRGAPPGLPFRWDEKTLQSGLNFTLTTSIGDIDLLGEITGGGRYGDLTAHSFPVEVFGFRITCLGLEKLIETKRAAGRPQDLEVIAELESIREEKQGDGTAPE